MAKMEVATPKRMESVRFILIVFISCFRVVLEVASGGKTYVKLTFFVRTKKVAKNLVDSLQPFVSLN